LNLHFGANAVCWPGDDSGTFLNASDLFSNPAIFYVAMWNKTASRWDICRGVLTNDFVLVRGMGLWISIRNPVGTVLDFPSGINTTANYSLTFGANFAGNPTMQPVQASAMAANSTDIFYIARWDGSQYQVYRPWQPGSISFLVQAGEATWISTRVTTDVIRYGA
jgi:hypothetical protein